MLDQVRVAAVCQFMVNDMKKGESSSHFQS